MPLGVRLVVVVEVALGADEGEVAVEEGGEEAKRGGHTSHTSGLWWSRLRSRLGRVANVCHGMS